MKKIYDVNLLLKPVRLYEQDSDATQAEDVDKKDEEEKGQEEKKDENDQKNNDGQENKEEEKNEDDQQANGNADQNNNQGQKIDTAESQIKTKLISIINEVIKANNPLIINQILTKLIVKASTIVKIITIINQK